MRTDPPARHPGLIALLAVAACSNGAQVPGDAGSVDAAPFAAPEGYLCEHDAGRFPESVCCDEDVLREPPVEVRTVVDLSTADTSTIGTCTNYQIDEFPFKQGYVLPSDVSAYPIKVVLPEVRAADPVCATLCEGGEGEATAFGIAMEVGDLIGGDSNIGLSFLVPDPWRFVSGGCGEACTWPCLGGYQEFGVRSCLTIGHGDFGFATADPRAPSVEVLIEAFEISEEQLGGTLCCLYGPGR